jgi:hypothetical protein
LAHEVARWQAADGAVLLLSYDIFKAGLQQQQQQQQDMQQQQQGVLQLRDALLQGACIVVADEAHVLRNEDTQVGPGCTAGSSECRNIVEMQLALLTKQAAH